MKSMTLHSRCRVVLIFAVLIALLGVVCLAQTTTYAETAVITQTTIANSPWVNLTAGAALADAPQAVPLSLAAADFNGDSRPNLIAGYETGATGTGAIGLLTLYPGADEATVTISLPIAPHWLATGDFNVDGRQDVVAAAQAGDQLFLLAGDGAGGFAAPETVALPGALTALAAGEISRQDGLGDLALGVTTPSGAQLLIYTGENGLETAVPHTYPLSAPITTLAIGQLDEDFSFDVAAVAGADLLILHGADQFALDAVPASLETIPLNFAPTALALGDFRPDEAAQMEIALLDNLGQMHLLDRAGQEISLLDTATGGQAQLVTTKSSSLAGDDLLVMAENGRFLHILTADGQHLNTQSAAPQALAVLEASAPFIAALPLRLNADGLDDLALLVEGVPAPQIMMTTAVHTFILNDTRDAPDKTPGDGLCKTNSGDCTLRAAIQEANASAGVDEIVCGMSLGAGIPVLQPGSPLPTITEAVVLEGGGLGQFDCEKMEINGIAAGSDKEADGLRLLTSNSIIRNVAIYNFYSDGIYIKGSDNLVEESILGTNNDGESQLDNGTGIYMADGASNIIQNNIVGGNHVTGIWINGNQNRIINGNIVGFWPSSPPKALPNMWGIIISSGQSNIVGSTTTTNGGNYVAGNSRSGIDIAQDASFTTVEANKIGPINASVGLSNQTGIAVHGANNTIGGSVAATNLIAYNTDGIHLYNTSAANNRITYNIIGGLVGNLSDGVLVSGNAANNQITNNEISGNGRYGIYLQSDNISCDKNQIRSNLIGTNDLYALDRGNGVDGILVSGVSCTTIATNDIYYNGRHGINIDATQPVTATITLNTSAYNGETGILLATNNNLVEENTLSYNHQIGMWVKGSYNQLKANKALGEDLDGNAQVVGIRVSGSHNTLLGGDIYAPQTEIRGHHGSGLELKGASNSVQKYYIHSNWDAGIEVTGDNNIIGAAGNGRNIISINYTGVVLAASADNNQLLGNYIGTELTGLNDAGNIIGVQVNGAGNQIGGAATDQGNRIGYSQGSNIVLSGSSAVNNTVEGNNIGPTVTGSSPGVSITDAASSNTLRGNNISSSRGAGVSITSGTGNKLLSNTILMNSGLGIDLTPGGVTLNDTGDNDSGANLLQNFPVISTVTAGTNTRIQGALSSKANTAYTVQFFANITCDASGYGEGETFLGQTAVTTNSSGQAGFDATLTVGGVLGSYVTATATDPSGNTSEFSKCVLGRPASSGVPFTVNTNSDAVDINIGNGICDSSAAAGEQCTLRAAVQEANFNVGADSIIIPAGDYALTLTGSDNLAAVGDLDITEAVTLIGAGADTTTIQGSMSDRIFEIRSSVVVTMSGVTVRGGAATTSSNGGGILVGGNGAALTLDTVTVRNNATVSGGGGGIYSSGAITLTNSAVVSNTTTASSPTSNGGGLNLEVGTATLINSTVSGNSTLGSGGGIYNLGAVVRLQNVTVAYNTADTDNNGGDGGGLYTISSTFYLRNSIAAQNVDTSHGSYPYGYADCYGTYTSESYNLIGDQAKQNNANPPGCVLSGGGSDSMGGNWLLTTYLRFSAGLGALQLNGGATFNHSPIASSAGLTVDAGNPAVPGSGGNACEPFDQRGQPRPIDGGTDGIARCDRGAVEHVPAFLSIGNATAVEGSPAQFTVSLSEPAQITFTVQVATTDMTAQMGQDYTQLAQTMTFSPGQTSKTIQVTTLTDTTDEDAETFLAQLTNPQYVFIADGEGIGTISDGNAVPSLLIGDQTVTEGDGGSSVQASFAVTLNSVSGKTVTVDYATADVGATAGEDYLSAQGQISFAPGVTTQTIAVTVLGDDVLEGNEAFTLQLSNPVNASLGDASGQGTITDDDTPAFSISDSQLFEGDSGTSNMVFMVHLSSPSTQSATVKYVTSPGTALAGSDYVHTSGMLTFAPGETFKSISVPIVGDEESETNERFTVSLNTPTGGTVIERGVATGLILDDGGYFVYLPMIVR